VDWFDRNPGATAEWSRPVGGFSNKGGWQGVKEDLRPLVFGAMVERWNRGSMEMEGGEVFKFDLGAELQGKDQRCRGWGKDYGAKYGEFEDFSGDSGLTWKAMGVFSGEREPKVGERVGS